MLLQYIIVSVVTFVLCAVSAVTGYLMAIAKPWLDKRFNQAPTKLIPKTLSEETK